MLRILTERNKHNWKDELNKLTYSHNYTRHSVSGFSPFYVMFGRNHRLTVDVSIENNTDEQWKSAKAD